MRSLSNLTRANVRTMLASAANSAALAFPPSSTNRALVPGTMGGGGVGDDVGLGIPEARVLPEIELEIWGDATIAVTGATLYAGMLQPRTFADQAMTSADATTDTITKAAHTHKTGDGPVRVTGAGLPGGLALATDYYVIAPTSGTYKLAASLADALAGTAINLTTNGTAMSLVAATDSSTRDGTRRLYWSPVKVLGPAGDGAIALTVDKMYSARVAHSPRTAAYALAATLDGNTISAAFTPVVDR